MQEVKNKWAYSTEPFGDPTLSAANNGTATWVRGDTPTLSAKGSSGWLAKLTGGVQTNDDYGRVNIPVNEMHLPSFATAKWSYYMTATESMGVNIVIWVHDPTDFDKRAEITQIGGHADLEKAAGWNAFEFSSSTGGMVYYGENVSSDLAADGTQYTWSQFISDSVFKTWDIYRITIEHGWEVSGSFSSVYVADLQLNEKTIVLKPSVEELAFLQVDESSKAQRVIPAWTFGQPTLRQSNAGQASWSRYQYQKGGSGWSAKLEGGKQAGASSWASMFVPVNELPVPDLATILWSYIKTDAVNAGISLQIWAHDPTDQKKRVEITQTASAPGTTAAWHSEELTITDSEYKWYGENATDGGGSIPDTCQTTNTNYTWAQYMSDSVFSGWTIYRIEFVIGWIGSDTLLPAHLSEVTINGTVITLGPKNGKSSVVVSHSRTIVGDGCDVNDVVSDAAGTSGSAWEWDVGASGKISQASIVIATNALTTELVLWLYTVLPTCDLDDNDPNTGPVPDDLTNLVGWIDFPAMTDSSAGGSSYTIASASTPGNLPLRYKGPILYGVLVNTDGDTLGGGAICDIRLAIDIEED